MKKKDAEKKIKTNFNFNKSNSAWKLLLLSDLGRTDDGTIRIKDILIKYKFNSRTALFYYEKQFVKKDLLIKTGKYPARYLLTPLAKQIIKKILTPSEGAKHKDIWRFHHYIRGYQVIDFGTFNFDNFKLSTMTNWNYVRYVVEIEHDKKIICHIQDTGVIKVYSPEIYGDDWDQLKETAVNVCSKAVQQIIDRFNMKLKAGYDIRRPHYALVNSETLAKFLINVKDPRVWVDFSPGTGEVETQEPEHIQNILDMPRELSDLRVAVFRQLNPAVENLAQEMDLHREIMRDIKDNLAKQTSIFKKILKLFKRGDYGKG